jgi:ABC-type transport system substrate-binding protein
LARVRGLIAAGLLAFLLSGCGEGAARFSSSENPRPGGGGALTIAIPPPGQYLDPLHADTPAALLVARQIFEPLVARQRPPYETGDSARGLALGWSHSRDYRVWAFRLRSGADFQDGEPFNAAAVSDNAGRWLADPVGGGLLPGLIAADDPRPGLVRFIFASPVRDLPSRLSDPRLGVISPLALTAARASGVVAPLNGGTGPFRLAEEGAEATGADIVLQRNHAWWGSDEGLGPALDELIFRVVKDVGERVRLLRAGHVRIATGLDAAGIAAVRAEPLLAVSPGPDGALGSQRSVHGIRGARPQSLAGVWIALIQTGASSP